MRASLFLLGPFLVACASFQPLPTETARIPTSVSPSQLPVCSHIALEAERETPTLKGSETLEAMRVEDSACKLAKDQDTCSSEELEKSKLRLQEQLLGLQEKMPPSVCKTHVICEKSPLIPVKTGQSLLCSQKLWYRSQKF